MKLSPVLLAALVLSCTMTPGLSAWAASSGASKVESASNTENYVAEPMPEGIRVVISELEGPVFADAAGSSLYTWPSRNTRNARVVGEAPGVPGCYDTKYRETVAFYQPYPAGNILPNVDNRPTCIQHWPPVYAPDGAKPVGNFTIVSRTDGRKQWAYKNYALYTSHLDRQAGQTNGGQSRRAWEGSAEGGPRRPAGPVIAVPPQFSVDGKRLGRLLVTVRGASVYGFEKDTPVKSNCNGACLEEWNPILAPEVAVPLKDWTILVRSNGERQWVFRGQPLYTRALDSKNGSYEGSDVPGWRNIFLSRAPAWPKGFKTAETVSGLVLTKTSGKTIYLYHCVEDTPDSLFCDTPDMPQEYRFAVCGANDPDRCLRTFPYVVAEKGAKSESLSWSIMEVDPKTGRTAQNPEDSLRVWAFRGRPIFTFTEDRQDGDNIQADNWGQEHGNRNGFKAYWVREDYDNYMD